MSQAEAFVSKWMFVTLNGSGGPASAERGVIPKHSAAVARAARFPIRFAWFMARTSVGCARDDGPEPRGAHRRDRLSLADHTDGVRSRAHECRTRTPFLHRLDRAAGLVHLGINVVRLAPGE